MFRLLGALIAPAVPNAPIPPEELDPKEPKEAGEKEAGEKALLIDWLEIAIGDKPDMAPIGFENDMPG